MSVYPKAPHRTCRKASRWCRYYQEMAAYYEDLADSIAKTRPASESAIFSRDYASAFAKDVQEIENRTHRNLVAGIWK